MFLDTDNKTECFGCEACVQACGRNALTMQEDVEGFRYPVINKAFCVECGICRNICPYEHMPIQHFENKYVFGGYQKNQTIRFESTSGGAFSAIVDAFCDKNYVIFGAEARGLIVFHSFVFDKKEIGKFRKSKYLQSIMGNSYKKVKQFLSEGKKVLFSGTPCQIAGLKSFLNNTDQTNLLTVEVVCEGVPSPLYIRKLDKYIQEHNNVSIKEIDYRYTGKSLFLHGKWDFEVMKIALDGDEKDIILDRWFNPFWSIWLNHLMSRPSCYKCKFANSGRIADITLGDLWGVHLYCPDLYGNNGGSSLIVCNTVKGKEVFDMAHDNLFGHELQFEEALKYQSPMRKTISENPHRTQFMKDLQSDMDYKSINRKWANKPTIKLLFQKYVWGNRQKVFFWNLKQNLAPRRGKNNA